MVNLLPFLTSLWFSSTPIINTDYGKIEGSRYTTSKGFETNMFFGIPYAKPPINDLRFEKSQPPIAWTNTLQAKTFGPKCASFPDLLQPNGKEDCLYLNIVAPAKGSLLNPFGYPVLVWIHGGAFLVGGSSDYNHTTVADRIVSRGIVFVSINYRVGAMGFFSTGDSNAPGNYGLWDQVQALKFIQKIIRKFGGNPNAVTVWGQSAGAQSASWLSMSPHAKNLFKRTIDESGSAFAICASSDDVLKPSSQLAAAAGCGSATNIKECLKGKTLQEIKEATARYTNYTFISDTDDEVPYHPRFDGEFLYASTFEKSIKKAPKREILMGLTSLETIRFTIRNSFYDPNTQFKPISPQNAANYSREEFSNTVHHIFGTTKAFGDKAYEAGEKIVDFYETQSNLYTRNIYLHLFTQLFSDIAFNIGSLREARLKSMAGYKVYYYIYNFLPSNLYNQYMDGTPHVTDLMNFYGSTLGFTQLSGQVDVEKVQKTVLDLYLNFVKYGKPISDNLIVPRLQGYSVNKYVEINTNSQIKNNLWNDRLQFWDKLSNDYGYDWIQGRQTGNVAE